MDESIKQSDIDQIKEIVKQIDELQKTMGVSQKDRELTEFMAATMMITEAIRMNKLEVADGEKEAN